MKFKQLLTKSLFAAVGLLAGQSVWGEEVILNPTADSWLNYKGESDVYTTNSTTNYGSSTTLTAGIWQDMWSNSTPGLKNNKYGAFAIMKFDVSAYKGKISAASFKITATLGASNYDRDLYIGYYTGTDWNETAVTAANSGINARSATALNIGHLGTFATVTRNSTAEYTCSSLSALVDYLNNDADGIVTLIFYTYTADISIASKEAISGKPTLTLTYTNETLYSATFNEGNSLNPTVTVYTDEKRTSEIAYNQLSANTTYYFKATLAGYKDYEGTFAVVTSNPTVNFTMTAKTRYTFTVNAVDESNEFIKAIYTDEDSYEGKSHTIVYPKYLTGTGNIVTHSKDNDTYGESKIAQAKNEEYTVNYKTYDGVAYFVEIEDVVSATAYSSWYCSKGGAVRGFTDARDIFTVPETGVYDITYAACNNNVNYDLAVTLSKNETEIDKKSDLKSVSINYIKSTGIVSKSDVFLASGDVLKLRPSTSNGIIDYILVESKKTAEFDYTSRINNPSFETFEAFGETSCNHPTGWTIVGESSDEKAKGGDKYGDIIESGGYWTGNYAYYTGWSGQNIYQTLTGMPAGTYKLTADATSNGASLALIANGGYSTPTAVSGNDKTTLSYTFNKATTGDMTIGIICASGQDEANYLDLATFGSWWYRVDNFTLTYTGPEKSEATITDAGWATLYTPYALDFSGVEGLKAYTATTDGAKVTLTPVSDVPANTGVVLEGKADTYSIPVIASSGIAKGDLQGSATEATACPAEEGYTYYILTQNGEDVQFNPATSGSIAAGKAFLKVAKTVGAKALSVMFANDPTGIATVNAAEVAQPVKRVVNGQLVIEKNGKRYNAAGAEF